jgi:hypothetical protein
MSDDELIETVYTILLRLWMRGGLDAYTGSRLQKWLKEYEARPTKRAADGACTCAKVRFYPDENVFAEDCPIHGTPRR